MELKKVLTDLQINDLKQSRRKEIHELIIVMLENIGSTDSELRDELIYPTFGRLIMEDVLDHKELEFILDSCMDTDHLFYGLGESFSDSVFTRSFSSLVITLILEKDSRSSFLPKEKVMNVMENAIIYLQREKDTRGYVDGKGWAHSIAHGSDLLVATIKHPFYDMDLTNEMLDTIQGCLFKEASYTEDEDERLIFGIEALVEKGIDESVLKNWLLTLCNELDQLFTQKGLSLSYFKTRTNVMNFLKTLYFRLMFKNVGEGMKGIIVERLRDWHKQLYGN